MAFKATISFLVWHLEPHLQFGVQGRCLFLVRGLEPPSLFSLAFRATISFQFGIQSHHLFLIWCSEPPSHLSYGV